MGTEKRERQKANRALKHQQQQQAVSRRKLYRKVGIGVAAIAALVLFVWIASNVVGDDEPSTPVTPVTLPETVDTVPDTTASDTTAPDTAAPDTTEG